MLFKIVLALILPLTSLCNEEEAYRKFNLTVIVLTMNRAASLARLMRSLDNTDFEFDDDKFDVEIHVDKSMGAHYDDCVKIARNYTPPNGGRSTPRVFEKNHGLRAAWFEAWYPKPDDQYAIIIEDDLEMSPFWFTWLRKAWYHYKDREDMAGIALQRQFMMFRKPEVEGGVEVLNDHEPFLYRLVGTWAFSPHPKHWREFLDWFSSIEDNETFDPYVPGMITSDWLHMHTSMGKRHMTWEQWHIYYVNKHNQYTLYLNLPDRQVLASNWREAGVHTRRSFNLKDYPTLDYCAIQLQWFPERLRHYGWDAKEEFDEEYL